MALKFVISLCLFAYGAYASRSIDIQPILDQHQSVMNLLVNRLAGDTGAVGAAAFDVNPNDCFNYYIPQQNKIVETYNNDYNTCIDTANSARQALTAQSESLRNSSIARGNNVCSSLTACEAIEDGLEFFQCYGNASGKNYQELYLISVDAEAEVSNLQISYTRIANDENNCTTIAKNVYVADMAEANSQLNKCLLGEVTVPAPTTTTSVPPTTTTSPPPTTTTEDTTTIVIDTTTTTASPEPEEPTTVLEDSTTELLPEEEIVAFKPMTRMNMWNVLRRL